MTAISAPALVSIAQPCTRIDAQTKRASENALRSNYSRLPCQKNFTELTSSIFLKAALLSQIVTTYLWRRVKIVASSSILATSDSTHFSPMFLGECDIFRSHWQGRELICNIWSLKDNLRVPKIRLFEIKNVILVEKYFTRHGQRNESTLSNFFVSMLAYCVCPYFQYIYSYVQTKKADWTSPIMISEKS